MDQKLYEKTFGQYYQEAWSSIELCRELTQHIQAHCGWKTEFELKQPLEFQPRELGWNFAQAQLNPSPKTEISVVCELGEFEGIIDVVITGTIYGVTTCVNVKSYAVRDKTMVKRAKEDLCQAVPVFGYNLISIEQEIDSQNRED